MGDRVDISIKVEGLARLNTAMKKLGDADAPNAVKAANVKAAQTVLAEALPNVPVKSGKLKGSIKALGSKRASSLKTRSPYGNSIHWGTGERGGQRGPHNIDARPFLWNARTKLLDQVAAEYRRELDSIISDFNAGR